MTEQSGTLLGKNLGNYLLTKLLGEGGFAEVYLGVHKHLETQAAIKVLKAQLNKIEQQDFIAEARTVARLKHPHIIRILEFGIEDDVPYLVMNYATNGTLRRHFPRGTPLKPEQFLPYLKQIGSALQYAHDQGLIHRDIKPENMLLDENDEVFLSDFGIATRARSSRSQTVEEVMGTVVYMAPEQLQGKPRPASDQYSLAVITYEWLCGVRPFSGSSYIDISMQQLKVAPKPLREHVATIPLPVEQVVLKALAKDPHWRYARVQDFVEALEQAYTTGRYLGPQDFANRAASSSSPSHSLSSPSLLPSSSPSIPLSSPSHPLQPVMTPPTQAATPYPQLSTPGIHASQPFPSTESIAAKGGSTISRRTLIGTGVGAGVLAVGGITWWVATHGNSYQSSSGPGNNGFKGIYLPQAKLLYTYQSSLTKLDGEISNVGWSKDGKYIASRNAAGDLSVWQATNGTELWSVKPFAPVVTVDWSPDGTKIAVINERSGIYIYDAATHKLLATSSFRGLQITWSPDSQILAVGNVDFNTDVALWDGNSAHTAKPSLINFDTPNAIVWRPDGKYLAGAFYSPDGRMGNAAFWQKGGDPAASPNFLDHAGPVFGISWSSASTGYIASSIPEGVKVWDTNTPPGQKYNKTYPQFANPALWSPDGRYIASATPIDNTVQVWEGSTASVASTCQGHTDRINSITWSPDGNYLATFANDKTVRIWQVRS